MGRRSRGGRRNSDTPGYVDLYHPYLFIVLLAIIVLSLADAYLTLNALAAGAREVNPVMNIALDWGLVPFVITKLAITGLGIALLCMHKNYPKVKRVIALVLIGYLILMAYHGYLIHLR